MAIKFRLRGLAETLIEQITCPKCGFESCEDDGFHTDETRVTFEGIVVVVSCKTCHELFVPKAQSLGIVDAGALKEAVIQDSVETGEPLYQQLGDVELAVEFKNADRNDQLH